MAVARRLTASSVAGVLTTGVLLALPWSGPAQAVGVEGTPLTFGSNGFGQLGDGSAATASRSIPGPVTGLDDVTDISGGREHVIALRSDGTVVTWGNDFYGQLGNGPADESDHFEPGVVPGLTDIVDVDDGHYHSIALKDDGTAWVWGFNSLGQLGNGTTTVRIHSPIQYGDLDNIQHVYGGRDMTMVLLDDGTVWCSGSNTSSECGPGGGTTSKVTTPIEVEGISNVVDLAGGRNHTLALKADGTVWSWGLNGNGQLGDGTDETRAEPEQVPGLSDIVDVGAGADHSIAVTSDGDVYTWGSGYRGQLGLGTTNDRLSPTQVPGINNAEIAEAGRDQTLIVTGNGHLMAWGWNEYKQSGSNTGDKVLSPLTVPNLDNVVGATGGQAYSIALQANMAPPEPVFTDGFDTGLSNWTGGTSFSLDNSRFPLGGSAPSLRANLVQQKVVATHTGLPAAVETAACATVMTRIESGSGATSVIGLASENGTDIARAIVGKNRVLKVRAEVAGSTLSSSQMVPRNQWHDVGVCVTRDFGSSDEVALTLDGNEVDRWTLNNGDHLIDQVRIGTRVKATAIFNLDDVSVIAD